VLAAEVMVEKREPRAERVRDALSLRRLVAVALATGNVAKTTAGKGKNASS
jgi:hypothetical protein